MRKIESQMVAAINSNKNWKSGNTEVRTDDANISRVFLHGNHIATIDDDSMMIMDGGWQSNTTKSRLNAIINGLCDGTRCGVFQKNYEWFITDNNETVDFEHGYTFSRVN